MKHRFFNKIFILSFLLLSLAACRVGKDIDTPQPELPKTFDEVSYADTSSIADVQWKTFFTDPVLQQLIQQGINYNYDFALAIKRIDIARQQVKQAKNLQLPELDLQVSAQYTRPSDNSLGGKSTAGFLGTTHVENYLAVGSLSWEADIWGKIRRQKEATLAGYLQTYEGAKGVQTQLVADIAQGYFNLLMLDKQLFVARRNLALRDSFVVATRLLRQSGEVTTLAVQQAESQRQTTALLIPSLEQDIALQENALQILVGHLPGPLLRQALIDPTIISDNLNPGVPVAMVSRRPDVRSAELALKIANAEVGIAQANMYPALNITAGAGLESFKSSNWFNIPGSLFGLAAGSIAQPLLQRRALKTRFEIAKIEREQAVIQFRQSVLLATGEVVNALTQIDKLSQQQVIAKGQVDTLNSAVFNAQLLFRSDMANYLEVITAQGSVLLAELNLASIERQQLSAKVELYRSLGGGWK
jgi:multidrug efflux system outer membrane protein